MITLVVVVLGSIVIISVMLALRTNRALTNIQQADPRRNPTAQVIAIARPLAGGELVPTLPPLPDALREPVNVLLLGVDKRPKPDEGVRSDTLILVHLDPVEKWASMLSIPRDSVVNIPHLGYAKINAAYSYGFNNAAAIYGDGTAPDAAGASRWCCGRCWIRCARAGCWKMWRLCRSGPQCWSRISERRCRSPIWA